jgi:uncharacterized protein with HEPN domain
MSTDFKEETHQVLDTREPMSEEDIIKALVEEFNAMFLRENLETNPSLVFKMNSSLEIPVTAIYKDKKVSSICTNLAIIREALSNSNSITYNREKEIIIPKIKAMRNKIILDKIPDIEKDKIFKTIYQAPEYVQKLSDKYIENLKSYTLNLRSEESANTLVEKIKGAVHKDSQLVIRVEHEDLYLDLLQKAQDVMKSQSVNPEEQGNFAYDAFYQNYGYFYGGQFGNPYMGMMGGNPYGGYRGGNFNNQYYSNYYNNMFIRKAQDEANEAEPQRGEYYGGRYNSAKKKGERYGKKPYFKNPKSEHKDVSKMSPEEIKRRTRLNSGDFPPLHSGEKGSPREEEQVKTEVQAPTQVVPETEKHSKTRLKFDKDQLIKYFKQVEADIKPNENLKKFKEHDIPILNLGAKPNLEFIEPHPVKKHSEHFSRKHTEDRS